MGPSGDYRDEMDRLSSRDADEVLSGVRPDGGTARVARAAADRLREELLVPPAPEVAERHLAAMRAAVSQQEVQGGIIQTRTRKRLATLALAATLVLGAGIAAALTLPDTAADRAKERTADVEAPKGPGNQGDDANVQSETASDHGKTVSEIARDDSVQGCDHGRAVSAAASAKAADNRNNQGDHRGDCGPNGGRGNGAAASAAKGNNGNHGQGNNGNHGQGNNGKGNSNAGGQGSNAGGQSSNAGGQSSNAGGQSSSANGNGKSGAPPGLENAPGQVPDTSSVGVSSGDLVGG